MTTQDTITTQPTALDRYIAGFWNAMKSTGDSASCPCCGQRGLAVRTKRFKGRTWRYVNHCHSIQPVSW